MITKNDLTLAAFEELRISGITVSPNPGEVESGVKRLDSMILGWQNKGLCLSYIRSDGFDDVDPNQDSGLNDVNAHAVILNLAKSLCPMYGKPLHPDTRADARTSYLGLFSSDLTYKEKDPYQPTGSGHSFGYGFDDRFRFQGQEDNAPENCDTLDIKVGETDFYAFNYAPDLLEGDTILSFVVVDGQGVKVLESSQTDGLINLKCEGLTVGLAPVKITITSTPSGRIDPQTINFNVTAT